MGSSLADFPYKISCAPMMDWTDRHCRYFLRLISPHALLYTEMVTANALIHGDTHYLLQFNQEEHPVALQLGGSEPKDLALCAKMAEDVGYDEVNINIGCPSERVQRGAFGACLMKEPELVAECVHAMQEAVDIPVTVKTRIGVDEFDSYEFVHRFVELVSKAPCDTFIMHARKAWLKGLSPKENREIPPLHYDVVARLQDDFPDLTFVLNGGIKTVEQVKEQLGIFPGVMLGREAYKNPYILAQLEKEIYGHEPLSRLEIVEAMKPYIQKQLDQDIYLSHITRHMLGLFQGQPGARAWRRGLTEGAQKHGADLSVIDDLIV